MFGKKKFEQSAALKSAAERGNLVGHGTFWKQGSGFRSWKQRRYEVYQNSYLIYLDASGKSSVVKGALALDLIIVKTGNEENVFHCGNPSAAIAAKRRTLTLETISSSESRVFETVFDTEEELIRFLNTLMFATPTNNIVVSSYNFMSQ